MSRLHRCGWWAFGLLLGLQFFGATLRWAGAQNPAEARRPASGGDHGRCVGVAASVARDGSPLVFRVFEDGTVEERRAEGMREGKLIYTWKPALNPTS